MHPRWLSPLVVALGCGSPAAPLHPADAPAGAPPLAAAEVGTPAADSAADSAPAPAGRSGDPTVDRSVPVGALPGLRITGEGAPGARVHRGADLSGDGRPDVLVGAPERGHGGTAWVAADAAAGAIDTGALVALSGPAGTAVGRSLAPLGDQDGDGFAELIVAADAAASGAPLAWVVHGPISSGPLADTPDTVCAWDDAPGGRARALGVELLGEDGVADLVLGLPDRGAAAAWPGPHAGAFGLADAAVLVHAEAEDAAFGDAVAVADLTGDGVPDLVVAAPGDDAAAPQAGAVVVFHGPLPADVSDADADLVLQGAGAGAGLGAALVADADLDDDGLADLVVGAPRADLAGPRVDAGHALALDGGRAGAHLAIDVAWARVVGSHDFAALGTAADAADLDGDGVADLALGAPGWGGPSSDGRGAVAVALGPLEGTVEAASAALVLAGDAPRAGLGRSVAIAGDIDQDGILDLAVGGVAHTPAVVLATGWASD